MEQASPVKKKENKKPTNLVMVVYLPKRIEKVPKDGGRPKPMADVVRRLEGA